MTDIPKRRLVILAIIFICVSLLSYYTYTGLFEESIGYTSYEIGNFHSDLLEDEPDPNIWNDYAMWVKYESNGAFIAGKKIHISIDLSFTNRVNTANLKGSMIKVIFPQSYPYPPPEGKETIVDGSVDLDFIDDTHAYGEGDIVYLTPERYSYTLMLQKGDDPYPASVLTRTKDSPYLAPLETALQIKNNNLILILTFFAVYLAIVQVVILTRRNSHISRKK